jgi:hypothetical protein
MIDYKRICIDELKCHSYKLRSLESLPEEIRRYNEQMDGIRSATSDATPVKGGGCGREDHLINAISRRDALSANLAVVKWQTSQVEKGLACLTEKQRRILELFYIRREYGYIQRLCHEFNESERQIYYDKDEALRRYALCRYGLTEL